MLIPSMKIFKKERLKRQLLEGLFAPKNMIYLSFFLSKRVIGSKKKAAMKKWKF